MKFTCGCGKSYTARHSLYSHLNTKHNGIAPAGTYQAKRLNSKKPRNFHCSCGKSYISYRHLWTHAKRIHNGTIPAGTKILTNSVGRPINSFKRRNKTHPIVPKTINKIYMDG